MLIQVMSSGLSVARRCVLQQVRRNLSATAVLSQKAEALDPIQQLFVQKVREYGQKSKSAGGKLVDATPKLEDELKFELEKLDRIYSATGKDMTQFPSFNFSDPDLEPVGVNTEVKEIAEEKVSAQEEVEEEDIRPYYEV